MSQAGNFDFYFAGKEEERGIKSRKEALETKSHNTASYQSVAEGSAVKKEKIFWEKQECGFTLHDKIIQWKDNAALGRLYMLMCVSQYYGEALR